MATAGAFMQSQAVYAAARLGVADALAAGPLPAAQLAAAVGAKEGHLRRVLRLLVLVGVFAEPEPGRGSEGRIRGGVQTGYLGWMVGLHRPLPSALLLQPPRPAGYICQNMPELS